MREINQSQIKENVDVRNINKRQIEEKYKGDAKTFLLKARDAYQKQFNEFPRIINPYKTVTYEIEFRDGEYDSLIDCKKVTLNHESELEEKVKFLLYEFLKDEDNNVYDEINWTADEIVILKNVKSGKFERRYHSDYGAHTYII